MVTVKNSVLRGRMGVELPQSVILINSHVLTYQLAEKFHYQNLSLFDLTQTCLSLMIKKTKRKHCGMRFIGGFEKLQHIPEYLESHTHIKDCLHVQNRCENALISQL